MRPLALARAALVSAAALFTLPLYAQAERTAKPAPGNADSEQTSPGPTAQKDEPGGRSGPNPVVTGGETPTTAAPGVPTPSTPQPGPDQTPPPPAPKETAPPSPSGAAPSPGQEPATQDDLQGLRTDLENFKFQWQREIDIHTATTTRALLINGVIQSRVGYIDQETNTGTVYKRKTTFDIPTAVLAFNGNLYKDYEDGRNLSYSLRFGASQQQATNNSFANLLDAFLTYSPLPTVAAEYPLLQISLGQQLLPFGLEVSAPEELKPVIRNAEFTTRLNLARRDVGLILRGDFFPQVDYGYNYRQGIIAYAVGVLNGSGPNTLDDNENKDIIARLAVTVPSDYNSFLRQITLGGTVYLGKQNTYLTDAARTLAGKGIKNRYGLDLYYNHWPFGVTAEYIAGEDVATPGKSLQTPLRTVNHSRAFTGTFFLSFGAQFVAGFRNQGKYDDWWPKTFQPFFRYDFFDPNTDKDKDQVEVFTGGLNIFFAETTKFQFNYNHRNDRTNPLGESNEVLGQFQYGF
jgi:hypothetical protein